MGAQVVAVATQRDNPAMRTPAVVLIAELRNFTSMSEMLDAARVLALADQFFECAADSVGVNGGEVIGVHNDSLLSVFRRGAPAAARHEEHHAAPVPRDPDLPTVSDASLVFLAAGALMVFAVSLFALYR